MPSEHDTRSDDEYASLAARAAAVEAIEAVGRVLAAELDLAKLAQAITDASTKVTGAEFGAFFYNAVDGEERAYSLYATSGAARELLSKLPMTWNAPLFGPTLGGVATPVRIGDVTKDPRHSRAWLQEGTPPEQAPLRSYLAAPVVSRTGAALGGLFFGHSEAGKFTEEHERLLVGVARYASIAVDNARLYEQMKKVDLTNERLAAIVQSSDDAIVSKDLGGIVQTWNGGAERMFGYSAAEMVGRPITVIIPPDRPNEETEILNRIRRGERVDHFETVRCTKDGRLIDVSVTISPLRASDGRIMGASKVARDITERRRAEIEREHLLAAERAARSDAERHSRMKDEFLATLGHELRTPLNAVLGWAHLLKKQNDKNEIGHGLEVIERNARLQAQLIEDLLEMSRIVVGKLHLSVQPVELSSVIYAAMESIRPAADAKSIRLQHVLDSRAGAVSGDPARLQQVIWNLLSNAVKFTPKGGRVQIVLERVNSHVEVSVSDTGEGISPEFLPLVFDRFRQADASTTRQHGGLGLGLAIVKHLVELHGGTVRAESPGKGQGSTFTVLMPVRATQHAAADSGSTSVSGGDAQFGRVSLEGLKVLIVDDEPDARELVQLVLEGAGAEVIAAASAAEALSILSGAVPDILVSDIGMPGEDGYSLIRRLRSLPAGKGRDVPAVALTAFARAEDRRRALLSGFQMHVPKPVEAGELLAVIASLTDRV